MIVPLTGDAGEKADAWMRPAQTAALQQQTDQLMWQAADALRAGVGAKQESAGAVKGETVTSGGSKAHASSVGASSLSGSHSGEFFSLQCLSRQQCQGFCFLT